MPRLTRALCAASSLAAICAAHQASAHGIAGDRFFPATLITDDPAVADELTLPTLSRFKTGDEPSATETDVSGEWSKRLTQTFGVSFADAWTRLKTPGQPDAQGFQNLETTFKWQPVTNAEHEAIVALGLSVEWGGTGAERVGAEHTTTLTPTVYFGKGFGDLPADVGWARPLAVTGVVGYAAPTRSGDTRSLNWGGSVQYSLRYLTTQVHDYGLPAWVNQLTPLVEWQVSQPVANRGDARTTGTINPGVIWSGRHMQLGFEAQVPVNRASGRTVGAVFQVHWFLDDLFPHSIGRPIW
jgi:hypothetical protein